MSWVHIREDDGIAIIELSRPKANAFNLDMVGEVLNAVDCLKEHADIRGIVFSSAQHRFFSSGFDVKEVFAYQEDTMRRFLRSFTDLYETVLRLEKPVVGALCGHTIAGGAFLALTFDLRIMTEGDFHFALNEINFAAVIPPTIQRMLINAIGPHAAMLMMLSGDAVKPEKALQLGLVDKVVPQEVVLKEAVASAHILASKPKDTFCFMKQSIQRSIGVSNEHQDPAFIDEFLRHWFSPACVQYRERI